jgi:hypothetical protein
MSDIICIQNLSLEILGMENFENKGRKRSVILKLKAGRLLNSVKLFRPTMSDGLQLT